jgi:mono/diheme cytochrome c family protein
MRGERLFSQTINTAPACSTCHMIDGDATLGPILTGYRERAATHGVSAEEYTYISIIRPGSYIVPGYANSMYSQYDIRLSEQQIADLMAYMLQF